MTTTTEKTPEDAPESPISENGTDHTTQPGETGPAAASPPPNPIQALPPVDESYIAGLLKMVPDAAVALEQTIHVLNASRQSAMSPKELNQEIQVLRIFLTSVQRLEKFKSTATDATVDTSD